jgi:hypothetical protein
VNAAAPFLLLGGGVVLVGLVAYVSYRADQRRRALLQGFALSQGWTYVAADDSWCGRFEGDPFGEGDHRRVRNVLLGRHRDRDLVAFDYSFQTHSSDSKGNRSTTTHRYAVCGLRLPAFLPTLELAPESVLTRFAGAIGFSDVELESEDFNRHYRVRAGDTKFAYDVLNPRTMAALVARPALHLRVAGADALCWESGRLEPAELLERLSTLDLLVDGIPSFVWSDHSPGGAPA